MMIAYVVLALAIGLFACSQFIANRRITLMSANLDRLKASVAANTAASEALTTSTSSLLGAIEGLSAVADDAAIGAAADALDASTKAVSDAVAQLDAETAKQSAAPEPAPPASDGV